jgi:hypothetical protein
VLCELRDKLRQSDTPRAAAVYLEAEDNGCIAKRLVSHRRYFFTAAIFDHEASDLV